MLQFGGFDLTQIVSVTFTLFAVIDMLGSIPIFLSLRQKMGSIHAAQATSVSGFLMLLVFFVGEQMLGVLGVDIGSFAIAGSIVIFILGLDMVLGLEIFWTEKDSKAGNVVPIDCRIIAGAGTLTIFMSLTAGYSPSNILIGILITLGFLFFILHSVRWIDRLLVTSVILVVRKFFGAIRLAIAIKIFRNNLAGFP